MKITQFLHQSLVAALVELKLPTVEVELERPTDTAHGDFATNVALVMFGQLSSEQKAAFGSPRQLAAKIVAAIKVSTKLVSKIEVAGPGFINFTLAEHFLLEELERILTKSDQLVEPINLGKKIIVEYSSPNIAKPFTIGHLRSTIIGDSIANLYEVTGAKVWRDNHVGDWGTQFGKQIYAIKAWGDETEIEHSPRPVKKLVELYVKFHQEAEQNPALEDEARKWFKKLEDGDDEARRLWQKCINWSWKEFNAIYQKLGVKFSTEFNQGRGLGESFFEDKMDVVIAKLKEKKLLQEGENGAKLVFFADDEYPPAMILKKDGATLYHTRDLATDKYRLDEYQPDLVINEVGAEQELYFKQLFKMEELLGWYQPEQRVHVKHGLFRFKDQKMSTRRGNVIWLADVLQEAYDRVNNIADQKLGESELWKIAIGALKYNDLKRKSVSSVIFDWDEIARLDGNSGPYLQYSYVRCQSVLRKAGLDEQQMSQSDALFNINNVKDIDLSMIEIDLLRNLYQYSDVVVAAVTERSPHLVCSYLYQLAQAFNSFYAQHSILQADQENQKQFRVALTQATAEVLGQGLGLLGIELVEEM